MVPSNGGLGLGFGVELVFCSVSGERQSEVNDLASSLLHSLSS